MNIRERYNIEESATSFSLYPKRPGLNQSRYFFVLIIVGFIALFFFQNYLEEALKWGICILLVYFLLHNWYDIQVGSKIQYIFDIVNDTICIKSPLYSKKKIMKLSEAVIFVQSEMGSWHYALGAKKSQFVKNHRISEFFSSGRKSNSRQEEYEKEVLIKIDQLIEAVYLKTQ